MTSVEEDGRLIEQVQGFPALYKKKDERFKNKLAKEQAWLSISRVMGISVQECENGWKRLRSKYTQLKKEIRDIPSGSASFTIKSPHFEAMGFLDPYLGAPRRTVSNTKSVASSRTQSSCSSRTESPNLWDTMSQMTTTQSDEEVFSPPPTPTTTRSGDDTNEGTIQDEPPVTSTPTNLERKQNLNQIRQAGQKQQGTKRTSQEAMCAEITSAISNFKKRSDDDKNGLLGWARSLASDMSILSREEVIVFKKQVYDLLNNFVEAKLA